MEVLFFQMEILFFRRQVPPLSEIPFDEHLSEIFGHIVWLWGMEIVRRDIRNRITKEIEE